MQTDRMMSEYITDKIKESLAAKGIQTYTHHEMLESMWHNYGLEDCGVY